MSPLGTEPADCARATPPQTHSLGWSSAWRPVAFGNTRRYPLLPEPQMRSSAWATWSSQGRMLARASSLVAEDWLPTQGRSPRAGAFGLWLPPLLAQTTRCTDTLQADFFPFSLDPRGSLQYDRAGHPSISCGCATTRWDGTPRTASSEWTLVMSRSRTYVLRI